MRLWRAVGLMLLLAAFAFVPGRGRASDGEFVKLYNGRDLSGWHAYAGKIDAWKADGEVLSCSGEGGGWLTSDRQYADFSLRLEWRIPKGGNSGVGLRYPEVGNPAHDAIEVQILDDDAPQYRGLDPAQYTGGIYFQVAPRKRASRPPGEWNRYEITCQGPEIMVRLNGEPITQANMARETQGRGGYLSLADRYRKNPRGHVGMQSHGERVDFRKIELRVN